MQRVETYKLLGILGQQQTTTIVKTYSAIDLLDKIFEFVEMTPSPNEWNFKSLKSKILQELIAKFGFPSENLENVDADFM